MNIYNKLFILEYSRDPKFYKKNNIKFWYMNLSKNRYHYIHRDFDLLSLIGYMKLRNSLYPVLETKEWFKFNKIHRLIGFSFVNIKLEIKSNHINGHLIKEDMPIETRNMLQTWNPTKLHNNR